MHLPCLLLAGTDAVLDLWGNTGPVARVVLCILLLFSIASWAIIFSKWSTFRTQRRNTRRFLRALYKVVRLGELHAALPGYRPSPAVEVFEAGYEELDRQLQRGGAVSLGVVERTMRAESADQLGRLEARMSWLATTASASPFIGLFGTVWGIIDAFQELGNAGMMTLRAVAPGISEALITTAAGLFAAIPALIAYNQFSHQLRDLAAQTDELELELLNRAEELARSGAAAAPTVVR